MFSRALIPTTALLLMMALFGIAQEKTGMPMAKGIQGSYLKQAAMVEQQLVSLAEAIPQEKYSWRPSEGVRSVAEAFLHTARGNYALMTFVGGKIPEGIDPAKLETSTNDKKAIVSAMQASFKVVNDHISSIPEGDLTKMVKFFGMDMSYSDMIMLCATHQHELLGQAVAYARMNNVVPPWTAERQARAKQQEKQ